MRKITFSKNQKDKLAAVMTSIFPEYNEGEIDIRGDYIRFHKYKKSSLKSVFVSSLKIPIFELIFTELPKRLSIYKCGNESFAPLYMVTMIYLLEIEPSSIADYIHQKWKEIRFPYDPHKQAVNAIEDIIKEEDSIEHGGSRSLGLSQRARGLSKTFDNSDSISREKLLKLLEW